MLIRFLAFAPPSRYASVRLCVCASRLSVRYRAALRPVANPPNPTPVTVTHRLLTAASRKRFQVDGHRSAGERNVPPPPPVLNGHSAFPLSGTERGTGGEDRNGEGDSPAGTRRAV